MATFCWVDLFVCYEIFDMKNVVIIENIRSAYNVGNILRTADGLGFEVILSGYTAHPDDEPKILKTSLGSEKHVNLQQFWNPQEAIDLVKEKWYMVIAAETWDEAISLEVFGQMRKENWSKPLAIIFWNERHGVLPETLAQVDQIVFIPMKGIKESFNVGQSSAIFMRELRS